MSFSHIETLWGPLPNITLTAGAGLNVIFKTSTESSPQFESLKGVALTIILIPSGFKRSLSLGEYLHVNE